jgi:hypothetical protein
VTVIQDIHAPAKRYLAVENIHGTGGSARLRGIIRLASEQNRMKTFITNAKAVALHHLKSNRLKVAEPTGLEPATSDVTGRRSNQLNYDSA